MNVHAFMHTLILVFSSVVCAGYLFLFVAAIRKRDQLLVRLSGLCFLWNSIFLLSIALDNTHGNLSLLLFLSGLPIVVYWFKQMKRLRPPGSSFWSGWVQRWRDSTQA